MAVLDDVNVALRISPGSTAHDGEAQELKEAATADLLRSGADPAELAELIPLIKRAIVTYCKANFGWDNPDADRLQRAYDLLKAHLTLSQDYLPPKEA